LPFYYRRSLQLMQYALWYTQVCFDRDLEFSRSRDAIGHVTIRFSTPHFLGAPLVLTLYLRGILRY